MKILLINSFYYPNMVGGTEHSVKLLAEQLIKNGNTVKVFTIDNLINKDMQIEMINGVEVNRCYGGLFKTSTRLHKNNNIINKIINKIVEFNNNFICKKLDCFLKIYKPNVVHVNNMYGLSPKILKIIKNNNIKIVYTIRDYWILDPSTENKNRHNNLIRIYQNHFRKYSNYVDVVTAPSKYTLNILIKNNYFKNANAVTIENAIDICNDEINKVILKRLNNNSKIINFIYVGGLEEKKGVLNLLKVFNEIKDDNIKLTVCGSGELKDKVMQYCLKDTRIKYLGQLSKTELENSWLKNDVCIVPSLWDEPFGRVVIEANQHGLPVIGSNKGGIKEILDTIKTGEQFQYNDLDDLKEKIVYFSNRSNIKKYYERIKNNINYYSLDKQVKKFMKIYK